MPRLDDMPNDSLDRIELELALEEAIETINANNSLAPQERERLIQKVRDRIDLGLWDEDDWDDDDALGVLVQRLGPKGPKGKSGGVSLRPEPTLDPELDDPYTTLPPQLDKGSGNTAQAD